jgi:hypothetical protein
LQSQVVFRKTTTVLCLVVLIPLLGLVFSKHGGFNTGTKLCAQEVKLEITKICWQKQRYF